MDETRLRQLAGLDTSLMEEYNASVKELDLFEKVYQGKHNLNIDTDMMPIEELQKRMDATTRALGLANRLGRSNPAYKKQHLSRILSNMNTIRAALKYMVKQAEQQAETGAQDGI